MDKMYMLILVSMDLLVSIKWTDSDMSDFLFFVTLELL